MEEGIESVKGKGMRKEKRDGKRKSEGKGID